MGKHEPMTAKAIANSIKAKGLQKIKYYCEMCKRQFRDDNGFKCHISSEAHQRQALVVSENPELFVSEFSEKFKQEFMHILRTRYKTKRVLANTVFQEQIKDREHTHMNATRWTTLSEFAQWLAENNLVELESSERGYMVTYIDRDPETLRRQELEEKRAQQAKEAALKQQKEIERQREATRKLYKELEKERPHAEPVPIMRVPVEVVNERAITNNINQDDDCVHIPSITAEGQDDEPSTSCDKANDSNERPHEVAVDRPVFGVQAIALKTALTTTYKPPKRKVLRQRSDAKKRVKPS